MAGNLNFVTGVLGVLIALVVGMRADAIGRFLGLLDWPDPYGGRKRHDRVTPLVGGLSLIVSFEVAALIVWAVPIEDSPLIDWQVGWLAVAAGTMALIGLADDRFGLSPTFRLLVSTTILTVTIVQAPDFRVEFLRFNGVDDLLILPAWTSVLFSLFCLIGLLNAVNMADGKNGLVITLAIIWTAVLFAHTPQPLDPLLFAVGGSLIVLLAFNLSGSLFLGDGGSYGVSAIFGLLAIYAYNHSFATFGAEQVAIMFVVPVLDTVRIMAWRVWHGRSPFAGDRNHLHHYLHARWNWPAGLAIYAVLVAVPNLLAVMMPEYSLAWLGLAFLLYGTTLWLSARGGTFRQGYSA